MFLSKVVIISILLKSVTSTCVDHHKGPCKRTDQCEPLVTPINSTHLLVNWEKAFNEDCEESHVEEIVIIVQRDRITKRKKVSSDQKETSVEADPCLSHSIRVVMKLKPSYSSSHKRSTLKSPSTNYNRESQQDDSYPFGGLLSLRVVPKICLKANGTIVIPSPPEALRDCGISSGEVKNSDFQEIGTSSLVRLGFRNPENSRYTYYVTYKDFEVRSIQACQGALRIQSDTTTLCFLLSGAGTGHERRSTIISASVLVIVLVLVVTAGVTLTCWQRWRERKLKKIDLNVDYISSSVDYDYSSGEASTTRKEVRIKVVRCTFCKRTFLLQSMCLNFAGNAIPIANTRCLPRPAWRSCTRTASMGNQKRVGTALWLWIIIHCIRNKKQKLEKHVSNDI